MNPEEALNRVNPRSAPSKLRITDLRVTEICGAPGRSVLIKIHTNQGLVGLGEVRDGGSATYALMLKSRLLGENPCNVDKLFRKLKQFGGHARLGGGVSGVELALWDLAGKAYGAPVYQMLGGRFNDRIRMYCDTHTERGCALSDMQAALRRRMDQGFGFLKIDVGLNLLRKEGGLLCNPADATDFRGNEASLAPPCESVADYERRRRALERLNVAHPFTNVHVTEKGLDVLEEYVAAARETVGAGTPLAIDHLGHVSVENCIKIARRLEKYHLAWLEDPIPWQYTDQYVRLSSATTTPICTGEDIYLKENFRPLIERRGVSVIHPDVLSTGGILETKKIADMAEEAGIAMAIHMAESPVACLAAAHVAAASANFIGLEFHSADCPWWDDLAIGPKKPIIQGGFIELSDAPGLGIEDLDDDVIRERLHPDTSELWASTESWNHERSHDRLWS